MASNLKPRLITDINLTNIVRNNVGLVTDKELKSTAIDICQFLEAQFLIAKENFILECDREESVIERVHIFQFAISIPL